MKKMMNLNLKRTYRGQSYCIGHLYINDVYFSDVLEDADRGLKQDMPLEKIKQLKVYCETAIPTGTYAISMDIKSPKYGKIMPRLLNVPGYSGVLIHNGSIPENTCGCLLVGKNDVRGMVTRSRETFKKLYDKLMEARKNNESIIITIE